MPTIPQAKKITAKTLVVAGVDRFMYSEPFELNQVIKDLANNTIAEYITGPYASSMTSSIEVFSPEIRVMLVDVGINVVQDMLIQRFAQGDPRSISRSAILFGVAAVVTNQLQKSTAMMN